MVTARRQAYAALGREDALALRWRDRAVAGLLSREITIPGYPHSPQCGRQRRLRRYRELLAGPARSTASGVTACARRSGVRY